MVIEVEPNQVSDPKTIAQVMTKILQRDCPVDQDKEHFWVIGLTSNNRIKYIELVTLGIIDQTLVHPREVFRFAIMQAITKLLICHNHPSGNVAPSPQDKEITEIIKKAGDIIGIKLIDHIIINGNGDHHSFMEHSEL